MRLFTYNNPKTMKGEDVGYLTLILHLAPHTVSGFNVCPMASEGCAAACLNTAGRGKMNRVQNARIRRTRRFFNDRAGFMADIIWDIKAGIRKANREDKTPVYRLNGTSDIRWETVAVTMDGVDYPNVMEAFPTVQFYDYTKLYNRKDIPSNYHLTFSRSESNGHKIPEALHNGMNIAIVFDVKRGESLPDTYINLPVVDGDISDVRFNDPHPCVVGLRAKGRGRKDTSGFVIPRELFR